MQEPHQPPIPPATPHYTVPLSENQGDNTGGLIPYKNSSALIAYYFGVFAIIPCCGPVLGIIALVLGIKGLRYANEHPVVKGKAHAWVGILCGGFWAIVYTIIPLLLLISMS